jgi:hypothetical protein
MDKHPHPAWQDLSHGEQSPSVGVQLALDTLVQHSTSLTPQDISVLMDHLELLMKDCSQANIQVRATMCPVHVGSKPTND